MKNTSRIMYRIGRIFNIFLFVLAGLLFFIGSIGLLVAAVATDEVALSSAGSTMVSGIVLAVLAILALVFVSKASRELADESTSNTTPFIITIVFGALSSNPFYILAGIFGIIAESQQGNNGQSQGNVIDATPVQEDKKVEEDENKEPEWIKEEQPQEEKVEKKDNFYVDTNAQPQAFVNAYGDTIISYKEYKAKVGEKYAISMTIGSVELASVGNSFSMNGVSVSDNIVKITINNVKRKYDLNTGIKAILIDGNTVYLGVQDKEAFMSAMSSEEKEDEENSDAIQKFDLSGVNTLIIKTNNADVDLFADDSNVCKVACDDELICKVERGTLLIDGTKVGEDIEIGIPEENNYLNVQIEGGSAAVNIYDFACKELVVKLTSGTLDANLEATDLSVSVTNGNADITQSFSADGSADLSSTSGSIDYTMENVRKLKLSSSGEVDNDFDGDEEDDGYIAEVTAFTKTGFISIS